MNFDAFTHKTTSGLTSLKQKGLCHFFVFPRVIFFLQMLTLYKELFLPFVFVRFGTVLLRSVAVTPQNHELFYVNF